MHLSGILIGLLTIYLAVTDGAPCCQSSCCSCCSGCGGGGGCNGGASLRQADPFSGQATANFDQVMRKVISKMSKAKQMNPTGNAIPDYVEESDSASEVRAAKPPAAKPHVGVGPIRYENDPGDPPEKNDPPPMAPGYPGKVVEPVYWTD